MSAPRVLFVDGDGEVPRGVAPVASVAPHPTTAHGLDLIAFDAIPEPREAVDAAEVVDAATLPAAAPTDRIRRPAWVMWRLLSGNNRELGRGASAFADLESAVSAVVVLRSRLGDVTTRIIREDRPGEWAWILLLGEHPVARSARTYQRLRECEYSLTGFLEALPDALLIADPSRVIHQRRAHPAAVEPLVAPPLEVR
jgi:hypothetical protein